MANVNEIGGSLGDFMSMCRSAFEKQFPPQRRGDMTISRYWVRDVFEKYIIVNDEDSNQLWRVDMTKQTIDTPGAAPVVFAGRDKWQKVKMTYATEMVGDTVVTEFKKGSQPEITPRAGVDLAELTAGDPDPFFLTVEIATVGRTSKNGLIHDATLADTLVTQINERAAEGIMGHIKETDRSTAFPVSDIHWLGAARSGNSAWARGYIPKTAVAQREHFRILKATNGRAATSITGPAVREFVDKQAGTWRATNFQLEQLDLAPHTRAALAPDSDFLITREMGNSYQVIQESEMTKEELLAQLTANDIPSTVREQIVRDAQAGTAQVQQVAELTTTLNETVKELTAVKTKLSGYEITIAEYQAREFAASVESRIAELTDWKVSGDEAMKKLTSFRKTLKNQLLASIGGERDQTKVQELVSAVWEDLKPLAETVRDALAGPAAVIAAKVRETEGDKPKLVITPESVQAARAQFSFSV